MFTAASGNPTVLPSPIGNPLATDPAHAPTGLESASVLMDWPKGTAQDGNLPMNTLPPSKAVT